MLKLKQIIIFIIAAVCLNSCIEDTVAPGFKDTNSNTIYSYLAAKEDTFSSFLSIIEDSGLDLMLSAYNPNGLNYTLFLPSNDAVDRFIENSKEYASLDELLTDTAYIREIVKFHVLNNRVFSKDFPLGAFSEPTLSDNILTVNIRFEKDNSYYIINDFAPVIDSDIESSNGLIHVISEMLSPLTFTTSDWLNDRPEYSIFSQALYKTGLDVLFNNILEGEVKNYTLFLEHDTVFGKQQIHSFTDLIEAVSPNDSDFTNAENPLYQFVAYHILNGSYFLDYFENKNSNYSTIANNPLQINGLGVDIRINLGKSVLDTVIVGADITYINFVGVLYDVSNVQTKTGAIHFVDYVMKPEMPSQAIETFEFHEDSYLNLIRKEPNSYLIEDTTALESLWWKGSELIYVQSDDAAETAWGDDYIILDGDFEIIYKVPEIVPGKYEVFINVNSIGSKNAIIEVFIDEIKMGSIYDLTKGGTTKNPYLKTSIGNITFQSYQSHKIKIKSLLPGRLLWDYIRFEPVK